MAPLFEDRIDAGRQLAHELMSYAGPDVVVVGLPRGGVPVAHEIAETLHAQLDVCIVRKVGAPFQEELAIGAVAEENVVHLHDETLRLMHLSEEEIATLVAEKRREVADRVERFRGGRPPIDVRGKTVIIVDDGLATGSTAHAALVTMRQRGAARIILAVPVAAADSLRLLRPLADEIVCPHVREDLFAVGAWYSDFSPTTDADVVRILGSATGERHAVDLEIKIPCDAGYLEGHLLIPSDATGVVLFAHGSGSSRHSSRNKAVAARLQRRGIGTLLFDLLTQEEGIEDEQTGELRFDIQLLASRLILAIDHLLSMPELGGLPLGCFGASTGAAAALIAAVERPDDVRAVVSRGGRPDLAGDSIPQVQAPTLLIVGSADTVVLDLNKDAYDQMTCEKQLDIVPGATHLFPEPGALEHVTKSCIAWFRRWFTESE